MWKICKVRRLFRQLSESNFLFVCSSRNQEKIRRACAYRAKTGKKNGKVVKPSWINCSSQKYYPSYNVSPQMNT